MSVDLVATLREPINLAALTAAARAILTELLGVQDVLAVAVHKDWIAPGARLSESQLTAARIGEHIDGAQYGRADPNHYVINVDKTGDRAWLMVMDFSTHDTKHVEAIFTPTRTCVGVVTATALALAAASCGGGEFVDEQIRMLQPSEPDVRRVIERTRLTNGETALAVGCARYMRQFGHLNGWPSNVSGP
jgi:hypothetical protein